TTMSTITHDTTSSSKLRRDILTGRLPATADTHALHGSFVLR
uniref:Uncharacterized protein n=1 Tax=Caenorhabditis japonica TaxID=281687 RepID=A0A8R1ILV1_CAEJA